MEHVSYYGFGPEENYIDRNKGAMLGRYDYNVTDNCTPYLYPQECGNRTHVKEVLIHGENKVLLLEGDDFEMSALHYTPYELENARHYYVLMRSRWVLQEMIHGVLRHMKNSC